jgi:hypothetical protein
MTAKCHADWRLRATAPSNINPSIAASMNSSRAKLLLTIT